LWNRAPSRREQSSVFVVARIAGAAAARSRVPPRHNRDERSTRSTPEWRSE